MLCFPNMKTPVHFGHFSVREMIVNGKSISRSERWILETAFFSFQSELTPTYWAPEPAPPVEER
jgi:hypothetical protein